MKSVKRSLMILFGVVLVGCVSNPPVVVNRAPVDFNSAMKTLTSDLFAQVKQNQGFAQSLRESVFVIDPFIDANTAEVNETSREIEQVLARELKLAFPSFRIEPMSSKNLPIANYVVNGSIRLNKGSADVFYRVSSSVVDLKTGKVIANSEVWVGDKQLKHEPVGSYRESPMYLKDKRVEGYIATTLTRVGDLADGEYFESLPRSAVMTEAEKAFDENNYQKALALYLIADERSDGKVMKTYSALYQCYRKLGKMTEAEEAFAKLVDVGLQNMNISTRFLFSVNSTEFVADPDLRNQYSLWMKHIARRVSASGTCLQILGHSSRTGTERYNETLSLQRALAVQKAMQKDFPLAMQKTRANGRGFKDNIIGSGSDDMQDAIDRRVEFKVVDCGKL